MNCVKKVVDLSILQECFLKTLKSFIMQWRNNYFQLVLVLEKVLASATLSYNIFYLVTYVRLERLTQNQSDSKNS